MPLAPGYRHPTLRFNPAQAAHCTWDWLRLLCPAKLLLLPPPEGFTAWDLGVWGMSLNERYPRETPSLPYRAVSSAEPGVLVKQGRSPVSTKHSSPRTELCSWLWDAPAVQLLLGILPVLTPAAEAPILFLSS